MKKRIVACLLGTVMVVSALAGCGNNQDKALSTSKESSKETESSGQTSSTVGPDDEALEGGIPVDYFAGTELNIAIVRSAGDTTEDFNEKPVNKAVEEATGIHINWTIIDASVKNERVAAMLASGELPDAMLGMLTEADISANMDYFYDLSKDGLLETYAPDVLDDYINSGQNCMDAITWPDGSIRNLIGNGGYSYSSEGNGILFINKTWLDNVGMDVPTTDQEFYNVLCAFRDQDANGNGDPSDEIPLSFCDNKWPAYFMQFANSWGIAGHDSGNKLHYKMLKNGVVEPTVDTEGYRAFLEYFHKLAKEGLLDIEGFSQTSEQFVTKQVENKVGIMLEWQPPVDIQKDYVAMKPFSVEGYETVKTGAEGYFYGSKYVLVASADCSNIEALLHWWNYMSSTTELKFMARQGEEGVSWIKDEKGNCIVNRDYASRGLDPNINYVLLQNNGSGLPYITPAELYPSEEADQAYRKLATDAVHDLVLKEYISQIKNVSPEAVEERTFIETDLFNLIGSFTATSVINGITDASWEKYLEDLKAYQYYEWIDWWQKYVDGEL